ncbi:MAG: VCBS repeat-containing protein [bacterium]|nr:VCBS repeat-containing protein [bacterium]
MNLYKSRKATKTFLFSLIATCFFSSLYGITWTETSFQDFIDGETGPGLYASHRTMLEPDSGCIEFGARFDANNDGYFDLLCSYWGADSGYIRLYFGTSNRFNKDSVRLYPVSISGGGGCLSDLNCDGYSELIHSGFNGTLNVYWGTATGPSITNKTVIPSRLSETVYTAADFNKDGWLDIAISSDSYYGYGDSLYIFWGTLSGYSVSNYTSFPTGGGCGHNLEVADLDKDGWPDIVVVDIQDNFNHIIYSPGNIPNKVDLPFVNSDPHGVSIADLNKDGWLDLVFSGNGSTDSYIYWGSSTGFISHSTLQPGSAYGGSAVADFDKDGWLDIIYFKGESSYYPIIYLNQGSSPYFSDTKTLIVGNKQIAASGGFVADFNFDDTLDICINSFGGTYSYVLYGPSYISCDTLPHTGDHHGTFMETGNTYTREYNSYYISSVFDAGDTLKRASADWVAYEPTGAKVNINLRSGRTPTPDSSWSNWTGVFKGDTLQNTVSGLGRFFQYQAIFSYENPCNLPWLEEITITLWDKLAGIETDNKQSSFFNVAIKQNPIKDKIDATFEIPVPGILNFVIYNLAGEQVNSLFNKYYSAGIYKEGYALKLKKGIYFLVCKLKTGEKTLNKSYKLTVTGK